ncbi:hypothetical protein RIF29_40410 [Crotalaria pallida]|uniref:Uncharacterized protein n=1 Tax=Crotalaria pallida TaxID=3830 RepID=A0AAN9E338_CROPI
MEDLMLEIMITGNVADNVNNAYDKEDLEWVIEQTLKNVDENLKTRDQQQHHHQEGTLVVPSNGEEAPNNVVNNNAPIHDDDDDDDDIFMRLTNADGDGGGGNEILSFSDFIDDTPDDFLLGPFVP